MSDKNLYNDISHIVHDHFTEYIQRHEDEMTEANKSRILDLEYSILNAIVAYADAQNETSITSAPGQMDIFDILGE